MGWKKIWCLSSYCVCLLCCLNFLVRFYSALYVDMWIIWDYVLSKTITYSLLDLFLPSLSTHPTQPSWPEKPDHEKNDQSSWKIPASSWKRHEYSTPLLAFPVPSLFLFSICNPSTPWSWEGDLKAQLPFIFSLATFYSPQHLPLRYWFCHGMSLPIWVL